MTPQRSTSSNVKVSSYIASIKLNPGSSPFASAMADSCITQVRLWIAGVIVGEDNAGRYPLVVEIAHMGDETYEDSNRTKFHFAYDMVNIQFSYETARAKAMNVFNSTVVFNKQGVESNWGGGDEKPTASTFVAIGRFTK